jgi:hypothetical protein
MSTETRRDGLLVAIALFALLIGTATGNAYAMFGISLAALVLVTIWYRKWISSGALLITSLAAVTAFAIAFVLTLR